MNRPDKRFARNIRGKEGNEKKKCYEAFHLNETKGQSGFFFNSNSNIREKILQYQNYGFTGTIKDGVSGEKVEEKENKIHFTALNSHKL